MPTYQTQQSSQYQSHFQSQDSLMDQSYDTVSNYQMGMGSPMSNKEMQEQPKMFHANQVARESVLQRIEAHHRSREERGVGLYYGDKSTYHDLSSEEKVQWLQEQSGEDSVVISPDELTKSSCIEWAMEHVKAWYESSPPLSNDLLLKMSWSLEFQLGSRCFLLYVGNIYQRSM